MEGLVESTEGVNNPETSEGFVVGDQPKDLPESVNVEATGTESNDPKVTTDKEMANCNESTDINDEINRIHDEINKKLEEIANLSNVEDLNKADSIVSEATGNTESVVTIETESSEVITDGSFTETVNEQPENVQNVTEDEVQCIEAEVGNEVTVEKPSDQTASEHDQSIVEKVESSNSAIELISEDEKSNPEMATNDSHEDVSADPNSKLEGHEEFTIVDEVEDSRMDEATDEPEATASEPTQNAADLVEDKLKNLVEGVSNSTDKQVDHTSDDHAFEAKNEVVEKLDEESGILTAEQIEITEVETAEVVDAEEVQLEFQVVDEDVSGQNTQATDETQSPEETITLVTEGADNGIPAEEIVYVEELSTVEETTNTETKPVSPDTELFIVTHEPETDPLQTPKEEKDDKPKKPRGRKPNNTIPSHVLGVDINNPAADSAVNGSGRPVLKPRLGVKVPYRNLSSQIVSKKEIEEEIMERFRQKQAQHAAERRETMFARKLTQRLASKIAPESSSKTETTSAPVSKSQKPESSPSVKLPVSSSRIEKDSDLLAILEGDDDDLYNEEAAKKDREEAERKAKAMEREIALKQLKELPNTPPVVVKPGKPKTIVKAENPKPVKSSTSSNHPVSSPQKVKPKSDSHSHNPKKPAVIEPQPQLKASMVLKTYSRKRKSVDIESILSPKKTITSSDQKTDKMNVESKTEKSASTNLDQKEKKTHDPKVEKKAPAPSEQKPDTPTSEHPYVTKSSRIIKKKVIWDPDEITPRAVKSPKPGDTPGSSKQATPVQKQPEKKVPSEKVEKKPVVVVDKTEKKSVQEKKSPERKPVPPSDKKTPKKSLSPKKVKRLSEIDRLLMDEGAVNMLYEVKNTEDAQSKLKKKTKTVLNIEKAEKEIRNRASELLKDLKQSTAEEMHKSLRRKESPPLLKKEAIPAAAAISRKVSKDSTRSTPPPSPAFPYEASRIIRRHSSSSFSSMDDGVSDKDGERLSRKRPASGEASKQKKMKKAIESSPATPKAKPNKDGFVTPKEVPIVPLVKSREASGDGKPTPTKMVMLKRSDKVVTIKLNYGESEPYFSVQILKDTTLALNRLAKDANCHGVIITSSSSNAFCLGLNYKLLVADTEEARKKKSTELATQVRDFLKCLLHFPKVLIAGVQGDCIGLGVTILSLFDMVIASDKAQFSMPYGTFGCAPEAAFLLTVPHIASHALASELFYTSSKLSASEAARHGLVTRLCWPEKYADELKSINSSISLQSMQSIISAKKQLRQSIIESTETAIASQTKTLIEHWISDECQNNFANFKMEIK